MSAEPSSRGELGFGVAAVVYCSSCKPLSFGPEELDRAERMQEFHDQFCGHATLDRRL